LFKRCKVLVLNPLDLVKEIIMPSSPFREQLLTVMLTLFKQRGWLKARGKQRTDSTLVLAKIRAIIDSAVWEKRCAMR
jgi:hypothetical protein